MAQKVGRVVKKLREHKGWSRADLAARAGISAGYVEMLESGRCGVPSLRVLRGIGDALRVNVETLLGPVRGL